MISLRQALVGLLLAIALSPICLAQSNTQELILPIVTIGFVTRPDLPRNTNWQTAFVFLNLSNVMQTADLEIFQDDGTLVTEGNFSRMYEIPANSIRDVPIFFQSIIPPPPFPQVNGWGRLRLPASASVKAHADVR
ncbi:MAG TPA: hypothetical protein VGQ81_04400, partial [Acidobacteriota bacterium]|nr:hypothetical protein [Acidobacteriota bacterium]